MRAKPQRRKQVFPPSRCRGLPPRLSHSRRLYRHHRPPGGHRRWEGGGARSPPSHLVPFPTALTRSDPVPGAAPVLFPSVRRGVSHSSSTAREATFAPRALPPTVHPSPGCIHVFCRHRAVLKKPGNLKWETCPVWVPPPPIRLHISFCPRSH